jgi:hypothetical protein
VIIVGILELATKEALSKRRNPAFVAHIQNEVSMLTLSDSLLIPHQNISTFSLLASMPYVAPLPPVSRSKNRFSLAQFELPPLQDPRDAWELAFPSSTPYGGSYFSTSGTESRNLIDKPFDEGVVFPEGGRRAWLVVFGSWCALFSSLGLMNTMGAFQGYISTHQLKHLDVAVVGWIFSLYAFLTFGVGLFVGPLFDKYGPKWLVLSGSVLVVLSMDLIGNCIGQYPFPWSDISLPNLYFF